MDQLTEYIKSTLAQGYSREQIKEYLISKGYEVNVVDNSFRNLDATNNNSQNNNIATVQNNNSQNNQNNFNQNNQAVVDNSVLISQLQNYIYTYLQQGYTPQQLYDYLGKQGYDARILNSAFQNIDRQYYNGNMPLEVIHRHDVSTSAVTKVGVMIMIMFFVGTGFFFWVQNLNQGEDGKLLDVYVTGLTEFVAPGGFVKVDIKTINMGRGGRFDVYYNYIIRDDIGRVVTSSKETKAIETTLEFNTEIKLPNDVNVGSYSLEIVASYDKKTANTKVYFTVTSDEVEEVITPVVPVIKDEDKEDYVAPVIDEDEDEYVAPITPGVTSDEELFSDAISVEDKNIGVLNCEKISYDYLRNSCFIEIASFYGDEEICKKVNVESQDICYMNLVVSGKYDVCSKVSDAKTIMLCKQYEFYNVAEQYKDGTLTYESVDDGYVPDENNIDDYVGIDAFI